MHIGYTGTQLGMSDKQKATLRKLLKPFGTLSCVFHHGDCVGGDAEAHEIATGMGFRVVIHPPLKDSKRAFCSGAQEILKPKDYLARNHDIVDMTELLIAAPKSDQEEMRSGTWATVRYARKKDKRRVVLKR